MEQPEPEGPHEAAEGEDSYTSIPTLRSFSSTSDELDTSPSDLQEEDPGHVSDSRSKSGSVLSILDVS